jgi:hypothetical protein
MNGGASNQVEIKRPALRFLGERFYCSGVPRQSVRTGVGSPESLTCGGYVIGQKRFQEAVREGDGGLTKLRTEAVSAT